MAPGPDPEPRWPPRSPRDALLSTPSGRRRYRESLEQTSPSPSPVKRSVPLGHTRTDPDDEDEDEETLQLKLQEIQARLRLKKLQSAKNREDNGLGQSIGPEPRRKTMMPPAQIGSNSTPRSASAHPQVLVPASPVRKAQPLQPQKSPVDKGLAAQGASLKRASSQRGSTQRTTTQALSRNEEAVRSQKQTRVQNSRSKAFGIGQQEMEEYKKNAVHIPDDETAEAPTLTSHEALSQGKPEAGHLSRSMTTPSLSQDASQQPAQASFEPYSCFHLSRRILPHRVLARHVSGKKPFNLKDLLRKVKAPDYSLPDVEQDIVVFAILARKSEPRSHNKAVGDRGKYMVMTIVDLKFEVELFLFNSGFTRFWKLTEGTVLAILNPTVMPPPPGRQDSGRFSLVINSDADTILEIGAARDLGFCKEVKKDGHMCGSWVNQKRSHICEFHSNEAIRKRRAQRMEMNSSSFGAYQPKSRELSMGKRKNKNYDAETKTRWFASQSHSAADLLDGRTLGPADKKERQEFLKRSLEAKEREREMMRQLGRVGNAAGKEYMQSAGRRTTDGGEAPTAKGRTADEAAIYRGKDGARHLSPIKRKRPQSSLASSSSLASGMKPSSGYGWGSTLKEKLSKMREGNEGKSPTRKKTRFVTDRGIREAGRESLGREAAAQPAKDEDEDEDEDELVIVG
ncbi:hypothetical protein CDD80_2712 [Ophiocordyceps camponoti-rufipedis]|uniref:Uncharacterized protein n=1 Tax=Ophiocordyceps camponoti-rufipedis TaxID=2004952 RepID=A0A2C5XJW1_9HYPO|nr:hypothetical protein CDD80_2712 [Ophiocordyceps camponoti-rufipedis]